MFKQGVSNSVHQAIAFAITSEFCRKRPFARDFHSENQNVSQFHAPSLVNQSAALNSQLLLEIWWLKFASEFGGRVRIRIRVRNRIAATPVHSSQQTAGNGRLSGKDPMV